MVVLWIALGLWERWKCKRKKYTCSKVGSRFKFIIITKTTNIMDAVNASAQALRNQIAGTEAQLEKLKNELARVEASAAAQDLHDLQLKDNPVTQKKDEKWPLSEEEYKRYGRQMIVPSVGIQGFYYLPLLLELEADLHRPTPAQSLLCVDHRGRGLGMSGSCIYCWGWRRKDRISGWRYS